MNVSVSLIRSFVLFVTFVVPFIVFSVLLRGAYFLSRTFQTLVRHTRGSLFEQRL